MTARLRVALISTTYRPDPIGIAVYATEIAEHLATVGHDVRVLTAFPHYPRWKVDPSYRGSFRRSERLGGVDIRRLRLYVPKEQSAIRRALYEASFFGHGMLQRAPRDADIVLSLIPNVGNGVLASWWARRSGAPHIMFIQDLSGNGAQEAGLRGGAAVAGVVGRMEIGLARRADLVTICSEGFRPTLEAGGVPSDKIVNFPNWCRLEAPRAVRSEIRERLGWKPSDVVVLHAGNMGMKQGLELVPSYAAHAREAAPQLRFVLMGDGSQRPSLEHRAAPLPNLEVIDPVAEGELPDVLAAADVLLLHERPTLQEMSVPSKLTAYFSVGRPVVAAVAPDGISAREVGRAGAGVVTKVGDPAAVVADLAAVGADIERGRALGDAGRAFASREYSRESAFERLDGMLDAVLLRRAERARRSEGIRPSPDQ